MTKADNVGPLVNFFAIFTIFGCLAWNLYISQGRKFADFLHTFGASGKSVKKSVQGGRKGNIINTIQYNTITITFILTYLHTLISIRIASPWYKFLYQGCTCIFPIGLISGKKSVKCELNKIKGLQAQDSHYVLALPNV